jgi:hypothetical protein
MLLVAVAACKDTTGTTASPREPQMNEAAPDSSRRGPGLMGGGG